MADQTKLVTDLVPGDCVPVVRTVAKVERTTTNVTLTFDDGTNATYDLTVGADQAVTVAAVDA